MMTYNTNFNKLKINDFPKVKPGEPPTLFVPLENYKAWCGDATYMHSILANYIRFNKDDKKLGGLLEEKSFRQEGKKYDIYTYSQFKYVHNNDHNFEEIISIFKNQRVSETSYWYGFDIMVHPSASNQSKYFMPLLDNNMMVNKINIKLELRYRKWKKEEIKRMWPVLFTLMSAKIPAKIGFCHELIEINSCIPIEIAHIIYEFARGKY